MAVTKEALLSLLIQKGFHYRFYEKQNLYFYTLEITDTPSIKKLVNEHLPLLHLEDGGVEAYEGIKFTVEIQNNFESPQWVFTNGLDEMHLFKDLEEFYEYVSKLPYKLEIV